MDSNVAIFFLGDGETPGFAKIIWNALCSFKIPGINVSAMSFMLGCLLLSLALKVLLSLFSTLSVSGGFSAGTGMAHGFHARNERIRVEKQRAERQSRKK